jgi:hypothetical protein
LSAHFLASEIWSADYKLFNRSQWEADALFEPLIETAVGKYCAKQIVIGLDDKGSNAGAKKLPPYRGRGYQ